MNSDKIFGDVTVNLESESVAVNSLGTIGFMNPTFTGSQTRYVCVNPSLIKEWAEHVDDMCDGEVWVGVTPDCPIIAKTDRDAGLALAVAPRVKAGDGE